MPHLLVWSSLRVQVLAHQPLCLRHLAASSHSSRQLFAHRYGWHKRHCLESRLIDTAGTGPNVRLRWVLITVQAIHLVSRQYCQPGQSQTLESTALRDAELKRRLSRTPIDKSNLHDPATIGSNHTVNTTVRVSVGGLRIREQMLMLHICRQTKLIT